MVLYGGMDFSSEVFITNREGKRVPFKVEEIEASIFKPYPEVRGYLIGSVSDVTSKKIDPIKNVIFNDPATIVLWEDGTKTVVKCQDGDIYSKELGLAMCISKKYLDNKGNFNEVFKKWIPESITRKELLDELKHYCYGTECSLCELQSDCEKIGRFETLTYSQLLAFCNKVFEKEED